MPVFSVVVDAPGSARRLQVRAGPRATVEGLLAAVGAPAGSTLAGRSLGAGELLTSVRLPGAVVIAPAVPRPAAGPVLWQVAGPGSGRSFALWPGRWELTRDGPRPARSGGPVLVVPALGPVMLEPVGPFTDVAHDGRPAGATPRPLLPGSTVVAAGRVYRLADAPGAAPGPPLWPPAPPAGPPDPMPPPAFSWAGVLLPMAAGAVLALVMSPLLAVMAMVGALGSVGRWGEQRWRHRRAVRRARAQADEWAAAHVADVDDAARREHRRRTTVCTDATSLGRTATSAVLIGFGTVAWGADEHLADSPVTIELTPADTIELHAPTTVAEALGRWLALALATRGAEVDGWDEPWTWTLSGPDRSPRGAGASRHWMVGDTSHRLGPDGPAALTVRWNGDGSVEVTDRRSAIVHHVTHPVLVGPAEAVTLARQVTGSTGAAAAPAKEVAPSELDWPSTPEGVVSRWAARRAPLTAVIGHDGHRPLTIDLVADGPHALVAGTTGSGKSELLRSLVVALSLGCDPEHLTFVLVDFKGGGAFDECARLPHVTAVVTDLDEHLAERALIGLRAEVRQREERLRRAGVGDLAAYEAAGHDADAPMPRLVVVVDELAALVAEVPAFVEGLIDVAQRGRSLGVHLILATQRPAGVVSAAVRANVNLRFALRVQSDSDALDVVDDPAPARLPSVAGRALVRVGAGPLRLVQTVYLGCPVRPPAEVVAWPWGTAEPRGAGPTDLAHLVEAISEAARSSAARLSDPPWLPPLPGDLELSTVIRPPSEDGRSGGPIAFGRLDRPTRRDQPDAEWDLEAGHLLVVGADGVAVDAALEAVLLSAMSGRAPGELTVAVLDAGSGRLARSMSGQPHVGAVARSDATDLCARVIRVLAGELDRRRADPSTGGGRWILAVSNVPDVIALLDEADAALRPSLAAVARTGAACGISLLLGAPTLRAVPSALAEMCSHRVLLAQTDPAAALVAGISLAEAARLTGMRAMSLPDRHEVHVATVDGAARSAIAARWSGYRPVPPVRVLGGRVEVDELSAPRCLTDGVAVAVGLDPDLSPVEVEVRWSGGLLVLGPPGAGVSTALSTIARQVRDLVPTLEVQPLTRPEAVDAWIAGRDGAGLVVVDDADLLPDDLSRALGAVLAAPVGASALAMVVGGRSDQLRAHGHWTSPLRRSRAGLVLHPAAGDGDVLRAPLAGRSGQAWPPGRGVVVQRGRLRVVQVAQTSTMDLSMR